ncbi:acylphosphatase [Kribbella antiqua]|uniref:Acylphosphatase n=1 Tax=Kribbella antiqua TaxID=2512217 RepID=A0A4R2IZT6_9ACTN|nr:acylphosphatase [Kribbella antiqua]
MRNRPDGTVEALFEGSEDDVRRMVEWARHGPPYARVERVDEAEEQPTGLTDFRVTR